MALERKERKPFLIAIVGPTASGKTDVAIFLAKKFGGEILNADSRQIYRGFTIGTGKPQLREQLRQQRTVGGRGHARAMTGAGTRPPTAELLTSDAPAVAAHSLVVSGIPHFGFDLVSPRTRFSAADFQKYARAVITGIVKRGHIPILVGGTGLYVSAVVDNLQFPPAPDPKLRVRLERLPLTVLWRMLEKRDPQAAARLWKDGQNKNRRRLIRYLEIMIPTGETLAQAQKKNSPDFDVLQIGLDWSRKKLFERIDKRLDRMIRHGWIKEVRRLRKKYGANAPAMSSLGYRELGALIKKYPHGRGAAFKRALADTIVKIKSATREYARRQMRWFKRDRRIKWVRMGDRDILKIYGIINRTGGAKIYASGIQTGARPFGRRKNASRRTRARQSRNGETF